MLFDHLTEVWVRHTYDVTEMPQWVSYLKKKKVQSRLKCIPPFLYRRYPIPIKKEKAEDLKS